MKFAWIIIGLILLVGATGIYMVSSHELIDSKIVPCYDDRDHMIIGLDCIKEGETEFDKKFAIAVLTIITLSIALFILFMNKQIREGYV
jgi:hypothetical protein